MVKIQTNRSSRNEEKFFSQLDSLKLAAHFFLAILSDFEC